jgi:hypothetical protein
MSQKVVYFHIRPDTNKVFYIGIGLKRRAYNFNQRNQRWDRVVNKAGGCIVELVATCLSNEDALELERFLIDEYKNLGYDLTNLSDGGEIGPVGYKHTTEALNKMKAKRNFKHTTETKAIMAMYRSKPISQYTKEGVWVRDWSSTTEAAKHMNVSTGCIYQNLDGKSKTANGFVFKPKI